MSPLQVGDRVDWREVRDGRITRMGLATAWVEEQTPAGTRRHVAPLHELKPARASCDSVRVGVFTLRSLGRGRMYLRRGPGEGMETDEAKIEGWMEKFWTKEF